MKKSRLVDKAEIIDSLDFISESSALTSDSYSLLIYAGGGLDKEFFSDLRENSKVELLWTGWAGPKWTELLSYFFAGQAGLFKVSDRSYFKEIFSEVASYSVSDALYVSKNLSSSILNEASTRRYASDFEMILKSDPKSIFISAELYEPIIEENKEYYFFTIKCSEAWKLKLPFVTSNY